MHIIYSIFSQAIPDLSLSCMILVDGIRYSVYQQYLGMVLEGFKSVKRKTRQQSVEVSVELRELNRMKRADTCKETNRPKKV